LFLSTRIQVMLKKIIESFKDTVRTNISKNGISEIDITKLKATKTNSKKVLNIFVHGYSALKDDQSKNKLIQRLSIDQTVDNWLFCWPSGFAINPMFADLKATDVWMLYKGDITAKGLLLGVQLTKMFSHFKDHLKEAENIGQRDFFSKIKNEIDKDNIKYDQINIIAHSLGSRLVCNALLHTDKNTITDLKINNLYLLAGAMPLDIDWVKMLSLVNGKLYNFYSKSDFVLMFKPDNEKCIGRYPIANNGDTLNKITNIETNIMHWKYWDSISKVFELSK
jgi:hypothetical protein